MGLRKSKSTWPLLPILMAGAMLGCADPIAHFKVNRLYVAERIGKDLAGKGSDDREQAREIKEGRERQLRTIEESLTAMFGTPDQPYILDDEEIGIDQVIRPGLLEMAAGRVGKDANGYVHGLYRQHCVHCHGVTGDGQGPTAEFLNPYPRDFRMGIFKFKSTPLGEKPTDDDLHRLLENGVPDTAMPSFKLLAEDERDALVNYVKYLAIRGEAERAMINELVLSYSPTDQFDTSRETLVNLILADIVGKWARANESTTEVPAPQRKPYGEELTRSVNLGRQLFNGKGNCFSCHGVMALGDGSDLDYDDWTKSEYFNWKGLRGDARAEKEAEFVALGGFPPRPVHPRNLRRGVFRGGRRPVDLYWRIRNGIEGVNMPEAKTLSDEEVWGLIDYVQQLPFEPISQPQGHVVDNPRINP